MNSEERCFGIKGGTLEYHRGSPSISMEPRAVKGNGMHLSDFLGKLGLAVLLPTLLFISAADLALFANIDTLGYGVGVVAARAALWLIATVVVFWLVFGLRGRSFRPLAARAVLFVAAYLLLNNIVFTISSDPKTAQMQALLLDGVTIAVALAMAGLIRLPSMVGTVGLVAFLILGTAVGQHALAYRDVDPSAIRALQWGSPSAAQAGVASQGGTHQGPAATQSYAVGNIYHVILDGFHGPSLPKLLEIGSFRNLDDFRHYPKFVANAKETAASVPVFMRGRLLELDEDRRRFIGRGPAEGLWKDLREHGFRISAYSFKDFNYCAADVVLCVTSTEFMETYFDRATLDLWFIRLLPASLWRYVGQQPLRASESFGYPFSITSWVLGDGGRRWRLETGAQHEMSLMALNRLLADEPNRADAGEYVYYHALPPHAAYVYDRNCKFIRGVPNTQYKASYQENALCALRLLDRLVAKLKELGRYDNALILVHSDHGHTLAARGFAEQTYRVVRDNKLTFERLGPLYVGHQPDDELPNTTSDENNTNMTRDWASPDLATRASALLFIKDPKGVVGPMGPDQLAQSLQIRPYILDAAGIEPFPKNAEPRPGLDSSGNPVYFMAHNKNGGLDDPSNISLFRFDGRHWRFIHTMAEAQQRGVSFVPATPEHTGARPLFESRSE